MAQVVGRGAGRRLESLRGQYIVDTWRGKIRIRAWPKKAKKKPPAGQALQRERFKEAIEAAKRMDPKAQEWAREMAAGTQLLPRDLLVKLAYGRLFQIILPDGRKISSMASRNDASDILDTIGQIPGSMLYRGPDWWAYIPPGVAGQVLTFQGEDQPPSWEQGGGVEGGDAWGSITNQGSPSISGSAYASKARIISPERDLSIAAVYAAVGDTGGTGDIMASVCEVDTPTVGGVITNVLAVSAVKTALPSQNLPYRFELGEIVTMAAGKHYLLNITRTNLSPTGTCRVAFQNGISNEWSIVSGPHPNTGGTPQIASNNPSIGDEIAAMGGAWYLIWAEGGYPQV